MSAGLLCCYMAGSTAQATQLQLIYTPAGGTAQTCQFDVDSNGVTLDPVTGKLVATGSFNTGAGSNCPTAAVVGTPSFTNSLSGDIASAVDTGSAQTLTWAADADSCTYDGTTLAQAVANWPSSGSACSNASACGQTHTVNITIPADGSYTFKLNCYKTGNATPVVSQVSTAAATPASTGCIAPAGLTRANKITLFDGQNVQRSNVDSTKFENIWGYNTSKPSLPTLWPGNYNSQARPELPPGYYLSAQFTVPAGMAAGKYGNFSANETNPESAGGWTVTISTSCGDFRAANQNPIAPSCVKDSLPPSSPISWQVGTNYSSSSLCPLTPGQTYYLNMIYAPLATPTQSYCTGTCGNLIANGPGNF